MWWRSTGDHWSLARLLTFVTTIIRDDDTLAVMCHLSSQGSSVFSSILRWIHKIQIRPSPWWKNLFMILLNKQGIQKHVYALKFYIHLSAITSFTGSLSQRSLKPHVYEDLCGLYSITEVQVETPFYKKALVGIFYWYYVFITVSMLKLRTSREHSTIIMPQQTTIKWM